MPANELSPQTPVGQFTFRRWFGIGIALSLLAPWTLGAAFIPGGLLLIVVAVPAALLYPVLFLAVALHARKTQPRHKRVPLPALIAAALLLLAAGPASFWLVGQVVTHL